MTTTASTPIKLPSIKELTQRPPFAISATRLITQQHHNDRVLPSLVQATADSSTSLLGKLQPHQSTLTPLSNYTFAATNNNTTTNTTNTTNNNNNNRNNIITAKGVAPANAANAPIAVSSKVQSFALSEHQNPHFTTNTPRVHNGQTIPPISTLAQSHQQLHHSYSPRPQPQPQTQPDSQPQSRNTSVSVSPVFHPIHHSPHALAPPLPQEHEQHEHQQHQQHQQPLYPQYNYTPQYHLHQASATPVFHLPAEIVNKSINVCHRCGTTETPEWRRGPKGVRTLCNACGLFHAKLVKRKGAAVAAEEVLNNRVTKGKNGRRISIKKHLMNESIKSKLFNSGLNNVNGVLPQQHHQQQQFAPVPAPIILVPQYYTAPHGMLPPQMNTRPMPPIQQQQQQQFQHHHQQQQQQYMVNSRNHISLPPPIIPPTNTPYASTTSTTSASLPLLRP